MFLVIEQKLYMELFRNEFLEALKRSLGRVDGLDFFSDKYSVFSRDVYSIPLVFTGTEHAYRVSGSLIPLPDVASEDLLSAATVVYAPLSASDLVQPEFGGPNHYMLLDVHRLASQSAVALAELVVGAVVSHRERGFAEPVFELYR